MFIWIRRVVGIEIAFVRVRADSRDTSHSRAEGASRTFATRTFVCLFECCRRCVFTPRWGRQVKQFFERDANEFGHHQMI